MIRPAQDCRRDWPDITAPRPEKRTAAALLAASDGRYLIQHRDDVPWIDFPDHWCLFGGVVEIGESCEKALRRELDEEIGFVPAQLEPFTQFRVVAPARKAHVVEVNFFAVPITEPAVARLVLKEGQGFAFLPAAEIATFGKIIPWDLAAILMHARHPMLFRPKQPRPG